MSINNSSIHQTVAKRLQAPGQNGWEFVCPTCGYQVRYVVHNGSGASQLEILQIGDPQVRHAGNHISTRSFVPQPINPIEDENDGDETWLTPELRQQMENLLTDIDMGDWEA